MTMGLLQGNVEHRGGQDMRPIYVQYVHPPGGHVQVAVSQAPGKHPEIAASRIQLQTNRLWWSADRECDVVGSNII
jgi:hypothetical protein